MGAASTFDHDALRPRAPGGLGLGATLALIAHGLLIGALALGLRWRTSDPEGSTAELWSAVPQVAAPQGGDVAPPPPPPPPPVEQKAPPKPVEVQPPPQTRDADIAIEREKEREKKRRQEEQDKLEKDKAEKAEKLKAEKARKDKERAEQERVEREKDQKEREQREKERQLAEKLRADEQRLAKQRQENLQRMLGQAGGTGSPGSTGTAARDAGPSASYGGRVVARIKPNIVLTAEIAENPRVEVEIKTAPDGTIVGRRVTKASGVKDWDDAVLRAIDRTEVLPRDIDGRVPSTLIIGFRPRD